MVGKSMGFLVGLLFPFLCSAQNSVFTQSHIIQETGFELEETSDLGGMTLMRFSIKK
jgi:hypothetical protein